MTNFSVADDSNRGASDRLQPFADLAGREFVELIFESAPRKVATRVGKALDHYTKALKLKGVDDEMRAIRSWHSTDLAPIV